jgi:YVTN family beta-propeller protein
MHPRIQRPAAPALVFLVLSFLVGGVSPVAAQYSGPGAIAVSPDGKRVYVLPDTWNIVAAIDPLSGQVLETAPVGQAPVSLAVSPDGRRLYASNSTSQTLSVIDGATFQAVATIDLHALRP